jgi:hypothetical protein
VEQAHGRWLLLRLSGDAVNYRAQQDFQKPAAYGIQHHADNQRKVNRAYKKGKQPQAQKAKGADCLRRNQQGLIADAACEFDAGRVYRKLNHKIQHYQKAQAPVRHRIAFGKDNEKQGGQVVYNRLGYIACITGVPGMAVIQVHKLFQQGTDT